MILIFIISVISVIILITSACMSLLCLKIMAMNMAMLTRLFTGVYTYHQFDNWIASAGMDNMIIWMMIG